MSGAFLRAGVTPRGESGADLPSHDDMTSPDLRDMLAPINQCFALEAVLRHSPPNRLPEGVAPCPTG